MPVKKILIVDDSPTDRHYLSELLSKRGYQCVTAEGGDDGIAKSKTELPDLILMDIVMPGNQETDRIWGMRQGAKDYVMKPIDSNELLAKVAALG